MDCWSYWGIRSRDIKEKSAHSLRENLPKLVHTPSGVQIGPIRVPVANNYGENGENQLFLKSKSLQRKSFNRDDGSVTDRFGRSLLCYPSLAISRQHTYDTQLLNEDDVDNEYNYIMNKALRSYRLHREKERAENRQLQLKTAYRRRWRAPSVPSKVRNCMSAPPTRAERAPSPVTPLADAIKEVGDANDPNDGNKGKKVIPVEVKRVTLSMDDSLSPKAQNYLRRNKSTHAWQSHSFPSANYLSQHVRQQFQQIAQTRNDVVPAAGKSSTSNDRPSSAMNYSYDGGIFLPHKPKQEYFVIHPDWVSESMTIQKLSLKDRNKRKTDTWPGRRCKSAPPPNERNIITWNNGESV